MNVTRTITLTAVKIARKLHLETRFLIYEITSHSRQKITPGQLVHGKKNNAEWTRKIRIFFVLAPAQFLD